ncbi:MAG TPA: FKBP-type peptidyl-prolyl cis-trans isomerase [Candidatus Nanoarchaeia archaeon]|nr:FKBP-type peptidyl-prolyl cis-trans isomerase [Candidatus Nanoarchaeia archaeon]
MTIKIGDFVEVDFIGRIKGNGVFDTNIEEEAKKYDLYKENGNYKAYIICVGQHHILKGLDDQITGKDVGEYDFDISAENGFGKKDAKLMKLVPLRLFHAQNIDPKPGLVVNVDGILGIVRSVSSGRCIVDFNHPLAGKDLSYHINIKRIITDLKEKLTGLLYFDLFLDEDKYNIDVNEGNIEIKIKVVVPTEITDKFKEHAKGLIKDIKELNIIIDDKKQVTNDN